ncbi:MAG: hypothetical protein GEV06_23430 [Luteitalea sp.]|nr:hypothetical protein [Luteitalea sp.]
MSTNVAAPDRLSFAAHHLAAGLSALNHGKRDEATQALAAIRTISGRVGSWQDVRQMDHMHPVDAQAVSIMERELAAMLSMTDGQSTKALELMRAAVAIEDKTPYEAGPSSPPKPAHELLGEMLLSLGQPQLARVQFELALRRAPARALSLLGRARALAGMGSDAAARETYLQLQRMWQRADPAIVKALEQSLSRLPSARGSDRYQN